MKKRLLTLLLCVSLLATLAGGCTKNGGGSAAEQPIGLYGVQVDGKWGFIDKSGNLVIQPQFEIDASSDLPPVFTDGLAPVRLNGKMGYINTRGKMVIEPQFAQARNFSDGLAVVNVRGQWGAIDKNGKVVIEPQYMNAFSFNDGLAAVSKFDGPSKWIFIDESGKTVFE